MADADPTKPELQILKVLWRRKDLSAREIDAEAGRALGWSYSTTRTVLERMVDKGLIAKRVQDGLNVYAAQVSKIALLGGLIRDFSARVLELEHAPPAALFADSKLLTHEELTELEEILREDGEA